MTHNQISRSRWLPGPWNDEPDFDSFEEQGYRCFLQRNELGVWCGYIELSKPLTKAKLAKVRAYGGVKPITIENTSYLSFSCDQEGDLVPGLMMFRRETLNDGVYRDIQFAKAECKKVVDQLV